MKSTSANALPITMVLWGIAALLLVVALPTRADEKQTPSGEFFATLEGHYLSNIGEKTRWGVLTSQASLLGPASVANFNILPKWGGGGRVGLGYRAASGWDVAALGDADWLYSGHQQTLITNSPLLLGSQVFIDRLTLFPLSGALFTGQVSADAQNAYNYVDLEGGYNVKLGTMFNARLFVSARYANFDQDIQTTGTIPALLGSGPLSGAPAQFETRREVSYWGVGPRLGASSRLRICESPFYLVSSVSGSVLLGEMRVRDQTSQSIGTLISNAVEGNTMYTFRTAYNGEGEVGVLYDVSPVLQGVDVTVGYRLSGWFGVNDTRPPNNRFFPSGESHANVVTQGTFLRINLHY